MLFRSRFAHFYERGGEICLFHSLSSDVLFGNRALLKALFAFPLVSSPKHDRRSTKPPRQVIEALRNKRLLIENDKEDEKMLVDLRRQGQSLHHERLSLMYLIPTAQCNLACKYCFIETRDAPKSELMSETCARQAVRYFFHHSQGARSRKIIFYGGEPLLNPPAIFAAADEARRLSANQHEELNLSLLTNGILLTPRLSRKIAQLNMSVSVSLDGPPQVHNVFRQTRTGSKTYSTAIKAIGLLRREGLTPSISCTVTPESLRQWDQVVDFIINDVRVPGLGFNLLLPGPVSESTVKYENSLDATTAILKAFERFRSRQIYEDRIMRRVKPFMERRFHYKDCLGVGGQIAVGPDGMLGPCQGLLGSKEYFPLHVQRDFERSPYSQPLFEEWTKRFPLNFEECLSCPSISLCGGGCPIASLREEGTIWKIDRRICDQVKPIHQWLMWDLHKKTNERRETNAAL
jgi:uncharacterized protein